MAAQPPVPKPTALEPLLAFGRLGLTAFGGPIAHLGYFRREFVDRRGWLTQAQFADVLALCQFLPGPASSQMAFALGFIRAGLAGALAAWGAFTLPSALLMFAFAYGARAWTGDPIGAGLIHGLKLMAVAVVAQAVLSMARSLAFDRPRAAIAAVSTVIVLISHAVVGQMAALGLGAIAGVAFLHPVVTERPNARADLPPAWPISRLGAVLCLAVFALLFAAAALPAERYPMIAVFNAFYRSGALVFGGGHVVLPLLREAVVAPGWVSDSDFLSGYGAAQALPGPLFTFSVYLGAIAKAGPGGAAGAALAMTAISLPGLLLVAGAMRFWRDLRQWPRAQALVAGVNAAVVGVLASALYTPVWTSAVSSGADFATVVVAFVLLVAWNAPPFAVVLLCAAAGVAMRIA